MVLTFKMCPIKLKYTFTYNTFIKFYNLITDIENKKMSLARDNEKKLSSAHRSLEEVVEVFELLLIALKCHKKYKNICWFYGSGELGEQTWRTLLPTPLCTSAASRCSAYWPVYSQPFWIPESTADSLNSGIYYNIYNKIVRSFSP